MAYPDTISATIVNVDYHSTIGAKTLWPSLPTPISAVTASCSVSAGPS